MPVPSESAGFGGHAADYVARPEPTVLVPAVRDRYWLHLLLFFLTLATTVYAGTTLVSRTLLYERAGTLAMVLDGFRYAFPLLLFLTVHEFGHYFAARHHRVSTTLPYYIPFPFIFVFNLGTLGAVIRIRQLVPSTRKLFDIGAGGPLAGFVVALGVLLYALITLPPPSYLLDQAGHEALKAYIGQTGQFPTFPPVSDPDFPTLFIGYTPLYWLLAQVFPNVPPMYEIYHYPVLFAGWLGLFFTALNLLPVGQLDGGHILYSLVGPKWHGRLARGFVLVLLLSGAVGFIEDLGPTLYNQFEWGGLVAWLLLATILYFFLNRIFKKDLRKVAGSLVALVLLVSLARSLGPEVTSLGYSGWFFWCLLIVVFIRVDHPPVLHPEPLTGHRRLIGILCMIIFFLCFSITPIYLG